MSKNNLKILYWILLILSFVITVISITVADWHNFVLAFAGFLYCAYTGSKYLLPEDEDGNCKF